MRKYVLIIVLIILIAALKFFSSDFLISKSNYYNFESLEFNIDKLLISQPVIIDNNFLISLPKDLVENSNYFKALDRSLKIDTNFNFDLIKAYNNDDILMYFGAILDEDLFLKLDSEYNKTLREKYKTDNIDIAYFIINDIKTIQYMFFNDKSVTIRLYIKNKNNFYEITYIINALLYKKFVKYIESSIGSIKPFKPLGEK
tara:strand:+ start:214 stop:816 length:603 start_codon:yes stop_codon:yes gene_type:complete